MSNEFTAAVTPPDPHPENALAFAFKKDQLLTRLQDEQAQVPTLSDLAGIAHTEIACYTVLRLKPGGVSGATTV